MQLEKSIEIIKALSDTSRLRILKALSEKPCYVEELSERLNLSPSTISFHLKKMQIAGLVSSMKSQYYIMYSLNDEVCNLTLREFVSSEDMELKVQEERLEQHRDKILRAFFKQGKLQALPVQQKKRLVILEEFRNLFEVGKIYPEKEVNRIIETMFGDYCTIRRLMIEEGWMVRNKGIYFIKEKKHD